MEVVKMKKKIKILNTYKELLLFCKRIQIINHIDNEIEKRIPTYSNQSEKKHKQKVLTLFR